MVKIKTLIYLCVFVAIFPMKNCRAQKNRIQFEFGGGIPILISQAESKGISKNLQFGFNFRKKTNTIFFTSIGIHGLYKIQNTFLTAYYDKMFNETINFETSFSQAEIGIPLNCELVLKGFTFSVGIDFKFLLNSRISMTPIGSYKTNIENINSKYLIKNRQATAMFNSINYAPTLKVLFPEFNKIRIGYQFSYDLEVNPIYYYFASYNTYYNTILINLNL